MPLDDTQARFWSRAFAGAGYHYGHDPGPVARRAVRYHRPLCPRGGTALDVGCGEGQDLAFLAEQGYRATGVDVTPEGVAKARRLLVERGLEAEVLAADLRAWEWPGPFDLVLAVNALQFLGEHTEACLARVMQAVAPGGVLGLSLFAREDDQPALRDGVYFVTLPELLARFSQEKGHRWQMLEAAHLWQWNTRSNQPQAFATLIALHLPEGVDSI